MPQHAPSDSSHAQASVPLRGTEHPVVSIPFALLIDGRNFNGAGASLVGAEASGLVPPSLEGETRFVTMQFAFTGFSVNLQIEARLDRINTESGTVSLSFIDPTGPHLPQLRYILNSFIAGDLVGVDSVIAVGEHDRDAPQRRAIADTRRGRFGRAVGRVVRTGAILLLAAGLAGVAGVKLYERFFVMPASGLSVLAQDGMMLRATSAGQIDYVDPSATKGDPLFAIRTVSGDLLVVQMPCDCTISAMNVAEGQTVLAGDPVLHVAEIDAPVVVQTMLTADAITVMSRGASALVRLPDGSTETARLDMAQFTEVRGSSDIPAVLTLDRPVSPEMAGLPVTVSVLADPFAGLKSLFGLDASAKGP